MPSPTPEMRHTPGPWTKDHQGRLIGSDGTQVVVADSGLAFASGFDAPERCANARLIAAAPRMYAVIEARAAAGDSECISIMEAVNGRA